MSDPTEAIVSKAVELTGMHDPTIQGLAWVVGIVALIIAIGKPIRDYLRSERKSNIIEETDEAKNAAEAALYRQLSEQVREYRELAKVSLTERTDLFQRIGALELKSTELNEARDMIQHLKGILDEKDNYIRMLVNQSQQEREKFLAILNAKDMVIITKDEKIEALVKRLIDLEVRVTKDEVKMVAYMCPMVMERNLREGTSNSENGGVA